MNHKKISTIASTFMRGAKLVPSAVSGTGVPVTDNAAEVTVTVGVRVGTGKIKVSAGNGARVVVGEGEAVEVGVNVFKGVPEVGDGVSVMVGIPVANGVIVCVGGAAVAVGVRDGVVLVGIEVVVCNGAADTERLPIRTRRKAITIRTNLVLNFVINIFCYNHASAKFTPRQ